MTEENLADYFSGKKLYGDNFSYKEIEEWFKDEEDGFANLWANDRAKYQYEYHALNKQHGFKYLGDKKFNNVLGLGSAYGDEFLPIADRIKHLTIVDASDSYSGSDNLLNVPCKYKKSNISGDLDFLDEHFDLIVCLGVLHHIPNISHVMNECYRCLSKGGVMLVREPIISMGDWRKPREGLTKRERGIPHDIFHNIITESGFVVIKRSLCNFPVLPRITNRFNMNAYNSTLITKIDSLLCKIFRFNIRYHAVRTMHKFRPASVYYVLSKK